MPTKADVSDKLWDMKPDFHFESGSKKRDLAVAQTDLTGIGDDIAIS